MAALVVRQLLLLYHAKASRLTACPPSASASSLGADGRPVEDAASIFTLPGLLEQLLRAIVTRAWFGASTQVVAHCLVVVTWVLPLWASLLILKMILGFAVQRFVFWYNRHYDRSFRRMFKAKHR
jgi:hypothetical protein